jgi:hypothetical protein
MLIAWGIDIADKLHIPAYLCVLSHLLYHFGVSTSAKWVSGFVSGD